MFKVESKEQREKKSRLIVGQNVFDDDETRTWVYYSRHSYTE